MTEVQPNPTPAQAANPNNPFKRAERKRAWIKLAMTGPSGAGKTMSALRLLRGFLGPDAKIAVIDTENDSASLYSDLTPFDAVNLEAPYTTQKYIAAIKAAMANKYDGLIIDTISHAWAGEGGLLQQKEAIDARGTNADKNKFANWASITKLHEEFKAWLLKVDIHMICTMRSKQDYVLGEGNKPQKVGMAPIQRDGMEYEFTTVFDVAMNHTAIVSKDRTNLFDQKIFTITEETGQEIRKWHEGGSTAAKTAGFVPPPPTDPNAVTIDQLKQLAKVAEMAHYTKEISTQLIQTRFKVANSGKLTKKQCSELMQYMIANPQPDPNAPPPEEGSFAAYAGEIGVELREPGEDG